MSTQVNLAKVLEGVSEVNDGSSLQIFKTSQDSELSIYPTESMYDGSLEIVQTNLHSSFPTMMLDSLWGEHNDKICYVNGIYASVLSGLTPLVYYACGQSYVGLINSLITSHADMSIYSTSILHIGSFDGVDNLTKGSPLYTMAINSDSRLNVNTPIIWIPPTFLDVTYNDYLLFRDEGAVNNYYNDYIKGSRNALPTLIGMFTFGYMLEDIVNMHVSDVDDSLPFIFTTSSNIYEFFQIINDLTIGEIKEKYMTPVVKLIVQYFSQDIISFLDSVLNGELDTSSTQYLLRPGGSLYHYMVYLLAICAWYNDEYTEYSDTILKILEFGFYNDIGGTWYDDIISECCSILESNTQLLENLQS